jgi:membrane protease YdiL (CAAX protease family)
MENILTQSFLCRQTAFVKSFLLAGEGDGEMTMVSVHPRVATRTPGARPWVADHPLATITGLVVTLGWGAMLAPILASRGVLPGGGLVDRSPVDVEKTAALAAMAVLVPAAFWVARQADGPGRLALVGTRMRRWRIGTRAWLLALVALPAATVLTGMALGRSASLSVPDLLAQLGALAVAVVVINLWEETMWAGVLQTRLEVDHRLPVAAFLVAVPFALLHVPLHFVEGPFTLGGALAQFAALLVLGSVVRLLFGLVLRSLDDSLLALAVFHASFNSANNEEGIGASVLGPDHQGFALLAVLGLLAGVALAHRGRLGRRAAQLEVTS